MKSLLFLLFSVGLLFLGLLLDCGDDDDDTTSDDDIAPDDDTTGDDDTTDDDTADDDTGDDDITDEPEVTNVTTGTCLDDATPGKDLWDPQTDPTNVVEVAWEDGVLKIDDLFAYVSCCVELAVKVETEGSSIVVYESDDASPCDCNCPIDFHYEITGLTASQIRLIVQRHDPVTSGEFTVVEIDLNLGKANTKWVVPFVEVMGYDGGTSSSDPVTLIYAACNLYHQEDQQLYVQNKVATTYLVYGYDWYDLDNPGTFIPACQTPVPIELGTLLSGGYFMAAPGHDEEGYFLKLPENPLVIP